MQIRRLAHFLPFFRSFLPAVSLPQQRLFFLILSFYFLAQCSMANTSCKNEIETLLLGQSLSFDASSGVRGPYSFLRDPIRWKLWTVVRNSLDFMLRKEGYDLTGFTKTQDDYLLEVFSFVRPSSHLANSLHLSMSFSELTMQKNENAPFVIELIIPDESDEKDSGSFFLEFSGDNLLASVEKKIGQGRMIINNFKENHFLSYVIQELTSFQKRFSHLQKGSRKIYLKEASLPEFSAVSSTFFQNFLKGRELWALAQGLFEERFMNLRQENLSIYKDNETATLVVKRYLVSSSLIKEGPQAAKNTQEFYLEFSATGKDDLFVLHIPYFEKDSFDIKNFLTFSIKRIKSSDSSGTAKNADKIIRIENVSYTQGSVRRKLLIDGLPFSEERLNLDDDSDLSVIMPDSGSELYSWAKFLVREFEQILLRP